MQLLLQSDGFFDGLRPLFEIAAGVTADVLSQQILLCQYGKFLTRFDACLLLSRDGFASPFQLLFQIVDRFDCGL
jgi:hypothetical protein